MHRVVRIVHVATNAQPIVDLIISLQTTSETTVVRSYCNTIVFQIVYRTIECRFISIAYCCCRIFLTKSIAVNSIKPIVWLEPILLTILTSYHTTKSCIRIQLTISTNKSFTAWICVDIIAQAIATRVCKVLICPNVCFFRCHTLTVFCVCSIVVKTLVIHFIVSSRVSDIIIVRNCTRL